MYMSRTPTAAEEVAILLPSLVGKTMSTIYGDLHYTRMESSMGHLGKTVYDPLTVSQLSDLQAFHGKYDPQRGSKPR